MAVILLQWRAGVAIESDRNHMNHQRDYNRTDQFIIGMSRAFGAMTDTVASFSAEPARAFPAKSADDDALTNAERRRSGRYMRVNHVGEICAQALYRSQALTARDPHIRERMRRAAAEENDHLAWCEQRIEELGARKSLLNPLWRAGAFAMGGLAGLAGDQWNLGFVAETERQVVAHLKGHLDKLPENDARSRAVVAQMKEDEHQHAEAAVEAGAAELPPPVKGLMRLASKVMTSTAHWI